jgi:hypothetical protein
MPRGSPRGIANDDICHGGRYCPALWRAAQVTILRGLASSQAEEREESDDDDYESDDIDDVSHDSSPG